MSIRDRIRGWIELAELAPHLPTKDMLNALELREEQRHAAIMGMLNRIEQRMVNQHVGQPREFIPQNLDWDTVQAIALADLERNPPKEN